MNEMTQEQRDEIRKKLGGVNLDAGKNDLFQYILKLEEEYQKKSQQLHEAHRQIIKYEFQLEKLLGMDK